VAVAVAVERPLSEPGSAKSMVEVLVSRVMQSWVLEREPEQQPASVSVLVSVSVLELVQV
jgi:hypothetical protein